MEITSFQDKYKLLFRSTWSWHFNVLSYLGAWVYNFADPVRARLFALYQLFFLLARFVAVYLLFEYLYSNRRDIKKLSWNLCVNNIFTGTIMKLVDLYHNHPIINDLRLNLYMDSVLNNTPEDELIEKKALKKLRLLRISYYGIAACFCPIWIICRYVSQFWGKYELTIPISIPKEMDPKNSKYFLPLFFFSSVGGCMGVHFIIESEMSMFSLFFQISREYDRFFKDILTLNDIYQDSNENDDLVNNPAMTLRKNYKKELKLNILKEINPFLRKLKAKILFKKLISRQQDIIRYTEIFEMCYNKGLVLHFLATFIVIVFNAILVIYGSSNLSPDVSFQFGLLILVLIDVFLMCASSQKLYDQCREVGFCLYSTNWYLMEPQFRRNIFFMLMRSQSPPKLTAGKLMQINLHTFMLTMKNIYSWLTLFRQLDIKVN